MAVIYACVEHLRNAGYNAAVLHSRSNYRYPGTPFQPPILASRDLARVLARRATRRQKLNALAQKLRFKTGPVIAKKAKVGRDDVLVVPEFMIGVAAEAFPNHAKVIFSQNSFGYIEAYAKAEKDGFYPDNKVLYNLGISDTCMDAFSLMSKRPQLRMVVSPDLKLFHFGEQKKRKIVYMPRKRRRDADLLHAALQRRGFVDDFELVRLEALPQAKVARDLNDSIIFVSLMSNEALGFPGIEAMASGCVVVGFTGLGTEEYFTSETGFPVREGDTAGLVTAVETVAAEYRQDPTRLDAMRRRACDLVRGRYNPQAFHDSLLSAWTKIDALAGHTNDQGKSGLELAQKSVN